MSMTDASDRFTALPDDQTLAATVVALEEHGFSVDVIDDLDARGKPSSPPQLAANSPATPGAPPA